MRTTRPFPHPQRKTILVRVRVLLRSLPAHVLLSDLVHGHTLHRGAIEKKPGHPVITKTTPLSASEVPIIEKEGVLQAPRHLYLPAGVTMGERAQGALVSRRIRA